MSLNNFKLTSLFYFFAIWKKNDEENFHSVHKLQSQSSKYVHHVVISKLFLMNLHVRVNIQTPTLLAEFDPINHSESELSYFVKNQLIKNRVFSRLSNPDQVPDFKTNILPSNNTWQEKIISLTEENRSKCGAFLVELLFLR